MWVGQRRGFFAKEELDVTCEITPNSRQMASDVFSGKYDIALTSIDNFVSYDEGQGSIELADRPDFVAFMGVDDGMLSLMAIPGIRQIGDLRGRTLSVELMGSGIGSVSRERFVSAVDGLLRAAGPAGFKIATRSVPLSQIEEVWSETDNTRRIVLTTNAHS